ncbi:hypothetical protein AX17_007362 [Amanita inopinata Kibby_2008]|nr:hypothetical protein AX17_007362 [Amanita inopinata Kibby_2008]
MASNHVRLPQRRLVAQRTKADENANGRHVRQSSVTGGSRFVGKESTIKAPPARTALGEVTLSAVNRKDTANRNSLGKEKEGTSLKRGRSSSVTLAQRIPLGHNRGQVAQPVSNAVHSRASVTRHRIHTSNTHKRLSRVVVPEPVTLHEEEEVQQDEPSHDMDVEEDISQSEPQLEDDANFTQHKKEIENMIGIEDSDEEAEGTAQPLAEDKVPKLWPEMDTEKLDRCQREVDAVRGRYEDVVNMYDTTMVSEYSDDIFEYMGELEENCMPNPNYMEGQPEINWGMRETLVDWLLQVHLRYHMLPETLWIAVNIVDRFLTKRVVSVAKLQLVGVTAIFIAAKYEEILSPSVEDFVHMTENGFTKDEILKGERIILQTLDFQISHYCSPYSWMRKISKADDYELRTRTLSKFLIEVTLLDHRFLRAKPSVVAAVGMFSARRMLGGDWNSAFVYQSGYTAEQLLTGHQWLVEKLVEPSFMRTYVCKKYANKKFLKASVFAIEWARVNLYEEVTAESFGEHDAALC